ncbi:unnamed protein product, partial [Mesorhabditis belari]|uniref:Sulfotransferase n=1 Tax=Mesorhabditis belari TaxID=2138241 RepID=A0AAF3ET07_9BILA
MIRSNLFLLSFVIFFFIVHCLNTTIESSESTKIEWLPTPIQPIERINPKHSTEFGVDFCAIPKTGSTITSGLLCDILRDYKSIHYKQRFSREIDGNTECKKHNFYAGKRAAKWEKSKELVKFTFIRHPTDRFVSLHGHFCISTKGFCQGRNIHEFAKWIYDLRTNKETLTGEDFGFNYHAYPQSSFCKINKQPIKVLRFSYDKKAMARRLLKVFKEANVPIKVSNKAIRHIYKSSTVNSKHNSNVMKQLKMSVEKNETTKKYVEAIYHDDFDLYKKAQ